MEKQLLIVGCGVFGLSTAIAAARGNYRVTVISDDDGNDELAASWGQARIFRTHYPRDPYSTLAAKAEEEWKLKSSFHKCLRRVFEPDGTEWEDDSAGWIDASKAMQEEKQKAMNLGVVFVKAVVETVCWSGSTCIGVKTMAGEELAADIVLLALGSRLPFFLRAHNQLIDDLCYPAVVPWICLELNEDEYQRLKDQPIAVYPGKGEYLPPNTHSLLCVNNASTLRVTIDDIRGFKTDGTTLPAMSYYKETSALRDEILGANKGKVRSIKYCPDLLTNSQDFLVDSVPEKEGLFIAAGGSFHAFKFLPVLGQEVLQTVEGKETIYQNFWSVKSHQAQRDPVHQEIIPKRNF